MNLKGVPDRYIDAFCGRVPGSVLAKHYSDFSPEILKEIYEKENIKILAPFTFTVLSLFIILDFAR